MKPLLMGEVKNIHACSLFPLPIWSQIPQITFVCLVALPFEEIESNPHTVMVVTSHGGHIGFIEGVYPHHKTWMNRAVKQLLAALKE